MRAKILFVLCLLNFAFTAKEVVECDGKIINHCKKCNSGENSDTCALCEDKYFSFFNDLLCLPCNDSTYGQIGCEGNCNGTDYINSRFISCEKGGCKEGYFNIEGICLNCSEGSPHCINCTYEVQEEATEGNFICHECESNEYIINRFGECEHCKIDNCEICHYEKNTREECDKCISGYYKTSYGECKNCRYVDIYWGICYICSDNDTDYENGECWCYSGYTFVNNSICVPCPEGCSRCIINNKTNNLECINCYSNYVLNNSKSCINCGNGCESCTLDENNKPICISCYSGTFLDYNKCLICPDGCSKCELELDKSSKYKNITKCTECYYNYALDGDNNCIYCSELSDTGDNGCRHCIYNKINSKFECLECWNDDYAYIINTFQCFLNTDPNQIYLYGCLKANYNEENNRYECLKCKSDFIQIINDKTCRRRDETNISSYCLEIENLQIPENPLYSCHKCQNNTAYVKLNIEGKKDCYYRDNILSFCLEGEIEENGNLICRKCVENAFLNSSNICNCDFDSFGKYNKWCYKCDDKKEGNPGCLASKGCNYTHSNDELDCNECKEGYFKYTIGQCYYCGNEISNCDKCHYDKGLKCDNCIGIFRLNEEKNKCEIDECQEYPEIAPGCIICKDKLNEYKSKNKCQSCKYGYFKTKNETCIYCRSEKYGGPGCYECGYEEDENGKETENIICKDCFSIDIYELYYYYYYYHYYDNFCNYFINSALSSEGKCYYYNSSFESCLKYEFIKDNKNIEKLKCIACLPGYYLDNEGNCVNYKNRIQIIPFCVFHTFLVDDIKFEFYAYDYEYYGINNLDIYFYYYNSAYNYYDNFKIYNEILKNINYNIITTCQSCQNGYFLNDDGICEKLEIENCTGSFILKNISSRENHCDNICYQKDYPFIYIKFKNNSIDFNIENYINDDSIYQSRLYYIISYNFDELTNETKNIILNMTLCYDIYSDEKLMNQFKGCDKVFYNQKDKSYQCFDCAYGYFLDLENNKCSNNIYDYRQLIDCKIENIGTDLSPLYSCGSCYSSSDTLVTLENGGKLCFHDYTLTNCIEVNASSNYINPVINCNSCKFNYFPFYSKYYGRTICQNIYEKIIKYKNITLDIFEEEEYILADDKGICKKKYFTPDGKKCYKCDNKNIGMPGCNGECSFSLKRNNTILCAGKCKDGYIESSEGICEECESINKGCIECHYEQNYPSNYLYVKKSRRFQCDYCKDGYILSQDGRCLTCEDLGIYDCEKCSKDKKTGNYICDECYKYFFKNEVGYCDRCVIDHIIFNNKCIRCYDNKNGGIEGCKYCEKNEDDKIICRECGDNYILLTNNNTCVERRINKDIAQFDNCLEIKVENNKYICSRCVPQLSLLKKDNEYKCEYLPTLYDSNFGVYYYHHFYYDMFKRNYDDYKNFFLNDYNFRQNFFLPCKESINLGTKENPIYSCTMCYNIFENEEMRYYFDMYVPDYYHYLIDYDDYDHYDDYFNYYDENYGDFTIKIIDSNMNNISYCMVNHRNNENCTEAYYKLYNGKEIYNCTKCLIGNELLYNEKLDINYCSFNKNSIQKCLVEFCKNCISNNNYFCSDCITTDYEVNKFSGSCVKKTEIVPAVTWKDIYRLNMNGQKEINGQTITGPSLNLRGITSSQINTRHAFLIYLTFKIKHGLRNLQEIIKIPAICEIKDGVEETEDFANIVDYECIGNSTVSENYTLAGIEEVENSETTINGNLNEINKIINENDDLINKNTSSFTTMMLDDMIFFYINYNNNIINSSDTTFDFCLNGTISKEINIAGNLNKSNLRHLDSACLENIEIEMNNINDKADCSFCSEENLNASLTCILKIKDDMNSINISFGTSEIKIENTSQSIYIPELNKINLVYEKPITDMPKSTNNKSWKTIICAIIIVVVLIILIFILLLFMKLDKMKNYGSGNININEKKMHNNTIQSDNNLKLEEKN